MGNPFIPATRRGVNPFLSSTPPRSGNPFLDEDPGPEAGVPGGGFGMLADIGRQGLRGLARSGYRTAIGVTDLLGFDDTADKLRAGRDQAEAFYGDAKTDLGTAAGVAGGLAGDAAQFAAPGALLSRIASIPKIAAAVPSAERLLQPATVAGRVTRDVALNAPVNLAAGIQPEESAAGTFGELLDSDRLRTINEDTGSRLGFEVLLDAGTGGLLESVAASLAKRGARSAARAGAQGRLEATAAIGEAPRRGMAALGDAEATVRADAPARQAFADAAAERDALREAAQARSRETLDLAKQHEAELRRAATLSGEPAELRYPLTTSVRDALNRFHADVGAAAQRRVPPPVTLTPDEAADVFPRTSRERRTISREEFGPVGSPRQMNEARKRAEEFLMSTMRGKTITNQATGIQAEIRKSAIGKARHFSASPEKISALRVLDELIEDAEPVEGMLNVPRQAGSRKEHVIAAHYFTSEVVIDGKPERFWLTLLEEAPPKGTDGRRVFYWDLAKDDPSKSVKGSLGSKSTAPVTDPAVSLPEVPGVTRRRGGPTSRMTDSGSELPEVSATSRPLGDRAAVASDPETKPGDSPVTRPAPEGTVPSGADPVNADFRLPYPEQTVIRESRQGGRIAWAGGDPKFRRVSTDELEAMHRRLTDEFEALAVEQGDNVTAWTRFDPNVQEQRSGVVKNSAYGRATAGMNQVWRQLEKVERELAGRYNGLNPDDLASRPLFAFGETGDPLTFKRPQRPQDDDLLFGGVPAPWAMSAGKAATENLLGGAVGATTGALVDEENPGRGMAVGFVAGAGGQAGLRALLERAGAAGHLVTKPSRGNLELPANRWRPGQGTPPEPPRPEAPPAVPPSTVDEDEFFNFRRALLDPSGERTLREEVRQVAATQGFAPKTREAHATVIARSLGIEPTDIIPGATDRLGRDKVLAIRNRIVTNADAIAEGYRRIGDVNVSPKDKELIEQGLAALEAQQNGLLGQFLRQRSEAGRDLAALRILAKRTTDPAVWLARAVDAARRPLTSDEHTLISRLANQGKVNELTKTVADLREPGWGEKLATGRSAMMLSNPKTHLKNLLGNAVFAPAEMTKEAPAAAADHLLSRLVAVASRGKHTSVRTKDFELRGMASASWKGAVEGVDQAGKLLQGKIPDGSVDRWDVMRDVQFKNPVANFLKSIVFRSLSAGDRVFYMMAYERSMAEQARLLAKREGLRGEALARRVAALTNMDRDPTAPTEMMLQAMADAKLATFRDNGGLATIASKMRQGAIEKWGQAGHVGANIVMPFSTTPSNLLTRALEYSPLGAAAATVDAMKLWRLASKDAPGITALQKQTAERFGRSATGMVPIVIGAMLAKAGRMTGSYPTDEETRRQWALEGKIPNAVKIGDKWVSLESYAPMSLVVGLGASFVRFMEDGGTFDAAQESLWDLGKTTLDQTYLRGVRGVLDALGDHKRYGTRPLEDFASSLVPSVVGGVARAIDPVRRDTEGPLDVVKSRIPGLSKTLPARVDAFGEEVRNDGPINELFNPSRISDDVTEKDWLVAELARVGATISRRQRSRDETPQQYERRLRAEGPELRAILEAVMLSPDYQNLPAMVDDAAIGDSGFNADYPSGSPARARLVREMQRDMLNDAVRSARSGFSRSGLGRAYAEATP